MKDDNGIVLPMPRKKTGVEFNEAPGPGLGFNFSIGHEEYITIAQAAKILGVSQERVREIVRARNIEKHDETQQGYYLLLKDDIEVIKHGYDK